MKSPELPEGFLEFVEAQAPERKYDYVEPEACAIAQFMSHIGFTNISAGPCDVTGFKDDLLCRFDISDELDDAVCDLPRTFGALALRLKELA